MRGLKDCATARYFEYHSGPYQMGISSKGFSLPLWTGIAIHGMLESVLRMYQTLQDVHQGSPVPVEAVDRSTLRVLITQSLAQAVAEARAAGFDEESSAAQEFVLLEQSMLAEGLVWGWIKACLPKFLADYEIVVIEQELPLDLETSIEQPLPIRLQTRPDLVLRRRSTGKLCIADWKSLGAGRISDSYIQEYREAPQMAVGTLATEKFFGEKVEDYTIFVLMKGGREVFESRGRCSPTKRTYSHLLYAKFQEPCPPFGNGSFELKGYWVDKQPSWEQEWLRTSPEQTAMEAWVERLPLETLYEMYAEIGPYPRQDYMTVDFIEMVRGEEARWSRIDAELKGSYPKSALVAKSYNCHDYGKRCSFYDLCFKIGDTWKDPIGSGKFKYRKPHHADELAVAEKNGVPL